MIASLITIVLLQPVNTDAELIDPRQQPGPLEIVEVRSAPGQGLRASIVGLSVLNDEMIAADAPTHPNELFDRVPGAWVSRGSGQEHLTAIRSPVLTGPGACGAFMFMEDRVPIRPAGFCNVNELFEVNLLQASRVDVLRGPGSVIYGSNALHGVLDVSSAEPGGATGISGGMQVGSEDYYRGRLELAAEDWVLAGNYTDAGSFRLDERYRHALANATWRMQTGAWDTRTQVSFADLDQDTAGFIFGRDAYRDPQLRTGNENPEAYRLATAWRVSSRWTRTLENGHLVELIPYARASDMEFLQHFLPGKPLETNDQYSAGVLFNWSPLAGLDVGVDMEWADGSLLQFQENPTEGSPFLMATRPQGFHYDYDATMVMFATWVQYQFNINDKQKLTFGLRAETLSYDYDNNMLDGNTRDDGTECGFGGCLYNRPADRSDRFNNLAPELGFSWQFSEGLASFARIARGFRAPQATELYRLQRGQQVADLDSETLDTLELGLRGQTSTLSWDTTAFAMRKEQFIFRDADGFNVSDGKTDHLGIEASVDWLPNERWRLSANASYARHEYAFDRPASGIVEGNDVDTAPALLAAARAEYRFGEASTASLEWVHMDDYWLDPANEHRYEGHTLLHARLAYALPRSAHSFSLRINNLLDDYYAERADFAFGQYRYFPGAGRQYLFEWRYQPI